MASETAGTSPDRATRRMKRAKLVHKQIKDACESVDTEIADTIEMGQTEEEALDYLIAVKETGED